MTAWHLSRAILETAWISAPTVLQASLGKLTTDTCDRRLDSWSRRLLEQARISVEARGLEHLAPGETYVVMSNHQSLYDIPVIFQTLTLRVRMVAKTELFRVPVWAQAMRAAGFVEVDRQNRHRAVESLDNARHALETGTSIWIAPEGTRSDSGELLPFKKGGFHLALGTGARILPVSIDGTRNALVARGFNVKNGAQVKVTVHAPIDPGDFGRERRAELIEHVRHVIGSEVSTHPKSPPPARATRESTADTPD
jgi:1-acyl-sn-glycerol-3-phosphate acyltransferase